MIATRRLIRREAREHYARMAALGILLGFLGFLALILLSGCASTTPTAFEQKVYAIETNYLPRVVIVTNVVEKTNWATVVVTNKVDVVNQVPVMIPVTNLVLHYEYETNVVRETNLVPIYYYAGPSTNAVLATGIAQTIAAPFGWAGIVGTVLGGLLSAFAGYRNAQNKALAADANANAIQSAATSAALAQIIETGRQFLQLTPQGAQLDTQWKNWMIQHQLETNTIQDVLKLLGGAVDYDSAKIVAAKLAEMIEERKPTTPTT
jgi:hypothetical protein